MNKCDCGHDHNCDCENNNCTCEEEMETMLLTLDDDTELECEVVGIFEVEGYEGKEYIALLPIEDETVLLYGYAEKDDDFELVNIENDDEFNAVSDAFYEYFGDDDEEEDEEEEEEEDKEEE